MIKPPRWIERVLSSFGAEPTYRDALLGDLTEEFTIRVEEQGAAVARRWYFREAVRSVPHLLRSWLRRCSPRDVLQLFGVAIAGAFVARLLGIAIRLAIVISFGVRPDSVAIAEIAWRDIIMSPDGWRWVAALLVEMPMVVAGFVAASLYSRARMTGAMCFAVLLAAIDILGVIRFHPALPAVVIMTSLNGSLVLLGGLLRVLATKREVSVRSRPHAT